MQWPSAPLPRAAAGQGRGQHARQAGHRTRGAAAGGRPGGRPCGRRRHRRGEDVLYFADAHLDAARWLALPVVVAGCPAFVSIQSYSE